MKGPCGRLPPQVTFSEFTPIELIHFYRDLKNRGYPHFRNFGNVLPYPADFFAENQSGPYGLYEQLLKDEIGIVWPKK